MPIILAFLTSRTGIIGAICVLVLGIIGVQTLRLAHVKSELAAVREADRKAEASVKAHERAAVVVSRTARAANDREQTRIQTVTKTLIKQVKVYVPASADANCVVNSGFVQLYNSAAAGVSPASRGPVEAPSGVPLSAVLDTTVFNFGVANQWRQEAMTWRDWYKAQVAEAK